ncbi:gpW family head-tail joining protein [Methylobacterium sp. A54F]
MATQAMLDEARGAYHKLMTRGGLVKLRHYEREMVYKPASAAELLAYITRLEGALGVPSSQTTLRRTPGRRIAFSG